ncbi:hypothetical protein [Saccharothrix stipae]
MPEVTAEVTTEVTVERRSFDLLDDGGPQEVVPDYNSGWLFAGRNSITVVTGTGVDFAEVTVESWDGEPPATAEGYSMTGTVELTLDSGDVEINPLVEDEAEWLSVGPAGHYGVRAYAHNQRYLFRFWRKT